MSYTNLIIHYLLYRAKRFKPLSHSAAIPLRWPSYLNLSYENTKKYSM